MLDLLFFFVVAAVLGAVAGGASAFTHRVLISNTLAKVHDEVARLEAKAAELKKAL